VITAAEVATGALNEAHVMSELMDTHHGNTGRQADTVVADSKYGTIENYLKCADRGVRAHIADLKKKQEGGGLRRGKFTESGFRYDEATDTYECPAGKRLRPKTLHKARQSIDYAARRSDCEACELRPRCTGNKSGRTVKRHLRQGDVERMRHLALGRESKKDIRTRQHLMERSFARAKRYGHGRARWRGLWRVRIQEYITAAIQNIQVLIKHARNPRRGVAMAMPGVIARVNFRFDGLMGFNYGNRFGFIRVLMMAWPVESIQRT
jgi:hypothetical protein